MGRIRRLRRAVKVAAHFVEEVLQQSKHRYRAAMITATYRPGEVWEPRDISRLIDRYQQWGKARGFKIPIVWVAELTQAGVVHYHLVLWVPRGFTPPMPDKQGWWVKGMTNSKWARKPVGYLCKYASKGTSGGEFPKGLRLFGVSGLTALMRHRITWTLAPEWLKELVPLADGVARVVREWIPFGRWGPARERAAGGRWMRVKGWWRNVRTGMCYCTPWTGEFVPGEGVVLTPRPIQQRRLVVEGP
jgi:hypothetical protein